MQHSELVANPYGAVKKLHADLVALGVQGLTLPTEAKVSALIRPSTAPTPNYLASERKVVGAKAHVISAALSGKSDAKLAAVAPSQWLVTERKSKDCGYFSINDEGVDFSGLSRQRGTIRGVVEDAIEEAVANLPEAAPRRRRARGATRVAASGECRRQEGRGRGLEEAGSAKLAGWSPSRSRMPK